MRKPARLLALFMLVVLGVYLLVFLTGDRKPTPNLGIDLQGGTSVTLMPQEAASADVLRKAQEILQKRVNGLGVSGTKVQIDGRTIVVTVPGKDGAQARSVGATSKLLIREFTRVLEPAAGASTAPADGAAADDIPKPDGTETDAEKEARLEKLRAIYQPGDANVQTEAAKKLDCSSPHPLFGADRPWLPLVTCDENGNKVLLGPAYTVPFGDAVGPEATFLDGNQLDEGSVSSGFDTTRGGNTVNFTFKTDTGGSKAWADLTSKLQGTGVQVAFTLDSKVISAPSISSATPIGQSTQITGSFTPGEATELANNLRYGSLPISFDVPNTKLISATQGSAALEAGLIAGAVALVLVLLYSLVFYRALGGLVALSLVGSAALIYGTIVLLGRWIGFSLDLAGIAGLIIGIGTTADSFVVFFERIKDEIRAGRTFRSAVPRGWHRAKRTIWSGNAVTLIASGVLYLLAVGDVKGFAFTLGVSTVFDLVVVFLLTAPLVHLASRSRVMSKPSMNGLGAVQEVAARRRSAGTADEPQVAALAVAGEETER